jgi:hypothetical protein
MAKAETSEPKTIKCADVDRVGFLEELDDMFAKPIRGEIKETMQLKLATFAEANLFRCRLVGGDKTVIDTDACLKLYEQKKLSRVDFLRMIAVHVEPARKIFSEKELAKISAQEKGPSRLTFKRMEDKTITLAESLAAVVAAIGT